MAHGSNECLNALQWSAWNKLFKQTSIDLQSFAQGSTFSFTLYLLIFYNFTPSCVATKHEPTWPRNETVELVRASGGLHSPVTSSSSTFGYQTLKRSISTAMWPGASFKMSFSQLELADIDEIHVMKLRQKGQGDWELQVPEVWPLRWLMAAITWFVLMKYIFLWWDLFQINPIRRRKQVNCSVVWFVWLVLIKYIFLRWDRQIVIK